VTCPSCGSPNVDADLSSGDEEVEAFECMECGHQFDETEIE
jgi:Zn ribbon nucleic-acid-binding protein